MYATEEEARRYRQTLEPLMFAPLARALVEGAALAADARVLDVGTGTGAVARAAAAAAPAGSVLAIDSNPAMLAAARGAAYPQPGPGGRAAMPVPAAAIEYVLRDVVEMAGEGSFDAIFCQQALQFFREPAVVLRQLRTLLRPEGRLHVALWGREQDNPFTRTLQRALAACGLEEFSGLLSRVHRLEDPAEVRALLEGAGWQLERHALIHLIPDAVPAGIPDANADGDTPDGATPGQRQEPGAARLLAATPLAARLTGLTAERRRALEQALEHELEAGGGIRRWRIPANLYTARAKTAG